MAFHHFVGHAAPQHRAGLGQQASKESVRFIVGNPLCVVEATVESDVDAEGQDSHFVTTVL